MTKFPMQFTVHAEATAGIQAIWACQADNLPPIPAAIPRDFMGPGTGYSPEDFFGLAVINCLIAIYKVYCEKEKIGFEKISLKAVVHADKKAGATSFVLPRVNLEIQVLGATDPDKAKQLLERAIRDCPVANSINSEKTVQFSVS